MWLWLRGRAFRRVRVSAANGCSSLLRAPYIHQTSLDEAPAANAWSIASTGVAPMPALSKMTGPSPGLSVKLPRGALASGALDWSFSPDGGTDIGVALTAAAIPLWLHLSMLHECRTRVEHALAVLRLERREDARRELKMLTALAETSLLTTGPIDEIEVTWREALKIAEGLSDVEYQLRALWGLWAFRLSTGHFRSSLEAAQSFRHLVMTRPDQEDVLTGGRMVGLSEHFLGDQASARENFERILANFSPSGQRLRYVRFVYDQRVVARANLGRVLWLQGYPDQAARTADAAVKRGAPPITQSHCVTPLRIRHSRSRFGMAILPPPSAT